MLSVNGHKIEVTQFPDRTSQVWKLAPVLLDASTYKVKWIFENEAELMHLAQLKTLLDLGNKQIDLEIAYLPYGRQDKEVSNQSTFALRPFATLLNTLSFNHISIVDPHSSIAIDLIKNSRATYPVDQVKLVAAQTESDLICYPDKGARTRYTAIYSFTSIYGEKVRDQQTGYITSYDVVGEAKGKRVLMVDDICDGGATFILLARELLKGGAKDVNLFVTHGLFSKGLPDLHASGIKRIFTLNGEAFETQNSISYKEL